MILKPRRPPSTDPGHDNHRIEESTIDDWRHFEPFQLSPILEGALAAFRQHGYYGASVRDIASRSGVTVPALYYHHENKQAMLISLLESAMTEVLHRAQLADAEGQGRVLERFANLTESVVLHMTHRQALAGLDAELRYLEETNRRRYAAQRKELEALLVDVIHDGVDEGLFDVVDASLAARALLGMWQATTSWFHADGPLTAEQVADHYVSLSLHLVGARVRPASRT